MQNKYLTKAQREELTLSETQKEILVGCFLGDLYARISKGCVNPHLKFEQGIVHKEYLLHLFGQFKELGPANPKINIRNPDKRTGKVYSTIYFNTYSLPCFNEFYNLFYLDGRKIVPQNIGELLTLRGLASWISEDGQYFKGAGLALCTNSFTAAEVQLLREALKINFKLDTSIHKERRANGVVYEKIYISKSSLEQIKPLLKEHMHESMIYKIGL